MTRSPSIPVFHRSLRRNEYREILKGFLPSGALRLRNWARYRRWFPQSFVSSDSVVSREAVLGRNSIVRGALIGDKVRIGDYTNIGTGTTISGRGAIAIGKFCSIAPGTFIWSENHNFELANHYPLEQVYYGDREHGWGKYEYVSRPITIENNVWLGHSVSVLPGAHIRSGCIVGAGCVVPSWDYPPYSIIGGVPGKVLKPRFSQEVVERLLRLRWWDYPESDIFGILMEILHEKPDEEVQE